MTESTRGPTALLACLFLLGMGGSAIAEAPAPGLPSEAGAQGSASSPAMGVLAAVGASTWTGDFGAKTSTDISAYLLSARYKIDDLRLTASMPYMQIRSTGAVFTGISGTPLIVSPSFAGARKVRQGWGDLTLGGAYVLPHQNPSDFELELSAAAKVPTASSASQISTGKADYAVGAQLSKPLGPFAPYVSISYRRFGDTSTWNLKDGFATSVGGSYQFPGGVVGLASYDYAAAASPFIADSHELSLSLSAPFANNRLRVTGFGAAGLSRGAAAVSGGLSLAVNLF